jgi:hypothetical protein
VTVEILLRGRRHVRGIAYTELMVTCWFIVIESGGRWWVDCEGRAYGPLDAKHEAMGYARKIAETYGDPKRQSQVWVPRSGGRPELIWSGSKPQTS